MVIAQNTNLLWSRTFEGHLQNTLESTRSWGVSQKYVFFRENNINRAAVALQNGNYKFSEWQNHRMTKSRYHKNVKLHKFEIMST